LVNGVDVTVQYVLSVGLCKWQDFWAYWPTQGIRTR